MARPALVLLVLSLCLSVPPVWAAEPAGFYRVERSVTDQSPAERERVVREGLRELLLRLSGRRVAPDKPALARAAQRSASLVQSFGFREPTAEERLLDPRVYVLQVDYDARAIKQLLAETGLTLWRPARPCTALWLALPGKDGEPGLLDEASLARGLQARLAQESRRRVLPLRLPATAGALSAADLPLQASPNDQAPPSSASPVAVAARSPESDPRVAALKQASLPLRCEAILTGALHAEPGGGLRGQFAFIQGEKLERWQRSAGSEAALLSAALDDLSERLVRSSVGARPVATQRLTVHVGKVRSLAEYGGLLRYLQGLSSLQAVTVQRIAGERVSLTLTANVDAVGLAQLFAERSRLRPASEAAGTDGLYYDWQP